MPFNQDSNEILGVLNANTDDSALEGMKEDIKAANKFNIQLSKNQSNARQQGYTESNLGVIHQTDTPKTFRAMKRSQSLDTQTIEEDSSGAINELEYDTSSELDSKKLHEELLGQSAYSELKHKVGLKDTDSFTDYYNRTHYVPKGYEMEARLALAEEKRMKLYADYQEGKLSETDFLYHAYGKDLMKEAGHDLDSTLYWYNQHKKGIYDSPLDSDSFLSDLFTNAREMWQRETWYQDKKTKTLSSSLAGVITGTQLSTEKVYDLFKDQFDVLDDYFDNDYKKIITYYQAGAVDASVFNPFIDINEDDKADYYYHLDGKLYAIEGSAGTGESTCTVEYTTDASGKQVIHSVDVTNGPDWLEGFGTGLRNFLMGFVDIGYLAYNAHAALFGPNSYGEDFVQNQQDYEAWKNRNYLGGKTEIVMDGSSEWTAYNISSAIGEIAGTIILTVLTWGAGAAGNMVKTAGTTAAKSAVTAAGKVAANSVDDIVRLGVSSIDDLARVGVSSLDDLARVGINTMDDLAAAGIKTGLNSIDDVGKELGNLATKYADDVARQAAKVTVKKGSEAIVDITDDLTGRTGKEIIKLLQRNGVDQSTINNFLKTGVLQTSRGSFYTLQVSNKLAYGAGQVASKVLDVSKAIFGTLSRAKTGQGFGAGMWSQALSSSAILAVQDFASTYTNLSAANKSLNYLASIEGSNVQALSDADIFWRAGAVAATDLLVSTMFRLAGSDGLTTKMKSLGSAGSAAHAAAKGTKLSTFFSTLSKPAQSSVNNLSKHLVRNAMIDNVADAVENIITSAVSIAANNAYEDFNIGNVLKGAGTYLTSPSGAMMTAYITAKNFVSAPKWTGSAGKLLWGESTLDSRRNAILESYASAAKRMDNYMLRLQAEANSYRQADDNASADAIQGLITRYNEAVENPNASTLSNQIDFIIEFDKKIGTSDMKEDEIITFLGLEDIKDKNDVVIKSAKDQATQIVNIMKEFKQSNPDMGVFTAYVLMDAKAKNVEETFKAYAETFDNAYQLSKSTTDSFKEILKGNVDLSTYFDTKSWQYQHVKKFIDALNEINDRSKYSHALTMSHIEDLLVENRMLKLSNDIKDFNNTFDTTFDVDILMKDAILQNATFTMENGKLNIDRRFKQNKALANHPNPLIRMFAFPKENAEAINKLINLGMIKLDANGHIDLSQASKAPIIGVMTLKPGAVNNSRDLDTVQGQLYNIYKTIADLGQAVDKDGNPVADWDTPLITELEIKNPDKLSNSGGTSTETVFVIGNKLDANLYQFFNKPKKLHLMVKALYNINKSTDTANLKRAVLNFALALSDIDESNLTKMTEQEREEFWEQKKPLITSAILSMSNASTTKTHKESLFTRERLLYLYVQGLITDETLTDIATSKVTVGVSSKARDEAIFLQNYIKTHDDVAKLKKMFVGIAKVVKEGAEVKLNSNEFNQLKQFLINVKKPENKLILDALREDKVIDENLDKLIQEAGVRFPFLKGLEDTGQPLVDMASAGTSSIVKDEAALKNFLVGFLNKAAVESFKQTYNPVYGEMNLSLRKSLSETQGDLKEINKDKQSLYEENQKIKKNIEILKKDKASKKEKLGAAIAIIESWNTFNQPDDVWNAMSEAERSKIRKFHIANDSDHKQAKKDLENFYIVKQEIQKAYSDIQSRAELIRGIKEANPNLSAELLAIKTLKSLLYTMDDVESSKFFKNPKPYLDDLKQELLDTKYKQASEATDAIDKLIDTIFAEGEVNELINIINSKINSKELMNTALSSINPKVQESNIKTYLTIALGESKVLDGDLTYVNGSWRYKDATHDIDVAETLLNSKIQTADIQRTFNIDEQADALQEIILNYSNFIHEDTVTKESTNVIEINILDLVPKEFQKLLTVYRNSIDAQNNHQQILEHQLQNELSGILDSSSYNYQTKEYIKLLKAAIASKSFILTIPIPKQNADKDSIDLYNEWRGIFKRLGYENDFMKLSLGEPSNIPGVLYKDKAISALETGLSFDVFTEMLKKGFEIKVNSNSGSVPLDYKAKLINMFDSVTYVTNDTELSFTENQVFYGVPKTGDIEVDMIGSMLLDRFTKAGLSGGEFAKVFNIMNRAMHQTQVKSVKAENSYKALRLFHKITDYFSGDFKNVTHEIPMTTAEFAKVKEFYAKNPNSLFIPEGVRRRNGKVVFILNPDFKNVKETLLNSYTKEFDIRTLIPVWGNFSEQSGSSDFQTAFSIAMSLGYSRADLLAMAKKPLEILDISNNAKATASSGKYISKGTFGSYLKLIPEDTDNYYLATKRAHVEAALAYSNKFTETLQEDSRLNSIIKFANRKSLVVLGNLLANPEFKNISLDSEEQLNNLLSRFNSDIKLDLETQSNKTDSINYYAEDITSADITKLTSGTSSEVTIEDLKVIISMLNASDNFFVTNDVANGLPEHNSAWAVLSCIDYDKNGAYISMEYYETLSQTDRKYLMDTLIEVRDNEGNTPVKKALNELIDKLEKKNKYIEKHERDTNIPTVTSYRAESEFANAPSDIVVKTIFSDAKEEHQKILATLVANRKNAKVLPNRFISSSSINPNTSYNPLTSTYMDIINQSLYRTVDKQGHTMVYNLNSQEAVAEFFGSIKGFKLLMQASDMFKDIDDAILYDLAMKANTYSTGTTIDAEYSGALILDIKDDGSYTISPVEVSSGDPSKGIYSHLLFNKDSGLHSVPSKKKIMITLNKNTFMKTPGGISSDVRAYDLNNEETRTALIQHAYYKAVEAEQLNTTYSQDMTAEKVLLDYYLPKTLTTVERYKSVVDTLKAQGVDDKVAEQILPSIQKLNVANATSFGEEQLHNITAEYISKANLPSEEMRILKDVLIHKITKTSLPLDVKSELNSFLYQMEYDISASYRRQVLESVELLLDYNLEDKTNVYNTIKTLPQEAKELIYKLIILNRQSGQDLNFLMNKSDLHSYSNFLRSKVKSTKNPALDYYRNNKVATTDSEWTIQADKFKKDPSKEGLYQIGFTITEPITDYNNFDSNSTKDKQYTILIKDSLDSKNIRGNLKTSANATDLKDTDLFFTEDSESFEKKRKLADEIGVGKTKDNVYVVQTKEDAIKLFEQLTSAEGVKHFAGYNFKAEGSDIKWFGDFFEKDGRQLLDVRTDVNHKVLSSTTEGLAGDSLDYYGEQGILTRRTAHDANSDVLDTIDLFLKIANNTVDTADVYDSLAKDALDFCSKVGIDDTDSFLKSISFGDVFTKSRASNQELFDSVDINNKNYVVGNQALKESMDAYNSILATRYRRIRQKELRNIFEDYIYNDTESRKRFISTVKDPVQRKRVQQVLQSLFEANVTDFNDKAKVLSAYENSSGDGIFNLIEAAVRLYKKETYKDSIESNATATEEFLSLDLTSMTDYIKRANEYYDKDSGIVKYYIQKDILNMFLTADNIQTRDVTKLKELWDSDIYRFRPRELPNETSDMYSYSYFLKPIKDLLGFTDEQGFKSNNLLGLDEDTATLFLNNIAHVYGTTEENYDRLTSGDLSKPANKINMFSNVDKAKYDEAIEHIFGDDFYSATALYTMAHEQPEGRYVKAGETKEGTKVQNGVVYISEALLKKAYPDLNYKSGEEFFTEVWRQPGQHKTVMHVVKVKVVDKGSVFMTRATAKTYFNGDFDGDFYYFAKPTAQAQEFGKKLNPYITSHMSLLDNLFDGIKDIDATIDNTLEVIEQVTHSIIKDFNNDIASLIKNPNSKLLNKIKENFIQRLSNTVGQAKAEAIWKDYGFKIVNFSELSNENKNILITNNPYIKTSADIKAHKELYHTLLQNLTDYLHANQYSDYFDSQVVGDIAKKLRGKKVSGKASDVLYTSRLALTEDINLRLTQALQTNGTQVYKNLTTSIDNLLASKLITKSEANELKQLLGSESSYSNPTDIDTLCNSILITLSRTQDILTGSKAYNASAKDFLAKHSQVTDDDKNKLKFLVDSVNTFLSNKITISEEDLASRPAILKKASEVINAMTTNKQRYYNRWLAASHSGMNNLLKNAVLKGNVDIDATDRLKVISNKDKVTFDSQNNFLGTKTIKVAVAETNLGSDTMLVTANNKDSVDTYVSIPDVDKLSLKQKEKLFNIIESKKPILSGHDLNTFLNTNEFNDNMEYTFKGAITKQGVEATTAEEVDQILVSSSTPIRNNYHYFKLGLTTGKAVKTTLGLSDVKFKDDSIGYILPKNMLINLDTDASQKLGPNARVVAKEIVEGSDGVKYRVYEISDAAIIDTSADKHLSVSDRKLDTISIMQGSQGIEAAISFGRWFLSVDGDDITYDPEGYRMLQDSLNARNNPIAEETNGMAELNLLKISSLINSLGDESFNKFCQDAKFIGKSRQEVLATLYKASDLGGTYGTDIINKLMLMIDNSPEEFKKFKTLRDSNPTLKIVWGTELNNKLQNSYRQTSQSFFDDKGKPIETYRSKKQLPKTNVRYAPMHNDTNLKNRMIAYDGSAIDYNTNYIGKFDLLKTLIPDSIFSKTKLDNLYNLGKIDYVKGRKGNLHNGFKFISEGQGKYLDYNDYEELLPDKKVGATSVEASLINRSEGDVLGLLSTSKGELNHTTNEDMLGFIKDPTGKTLAPALHTRLGMMFGDGSDESIYNNFFPENTTVGYSSSRPYIGIRDNEMQIKTASYSNPNQSLTGEKGVKQQIISDTKAPTAAIKLEKIRKSKEAMIDNIKDTINFISSTFNNKTHSKEIENIIILYKDSEVPHKLEANETFWKTLHIQNQDTEYKDTINLVKLYSNSNDVDLVDNVLRSWGYSAKGHKDINLGSATISLDKNAEGYKQQILSRDYDTIVSILKRDKNLNYAFNYYMDISRRLDMYEELTANESKWKKQLGLKKYTSYIKEAENQLLNGFSSIEEVKDKLISLKRNNPTLFTLVDAADKIHKRIQSSARELNPYTILGYSIPIYKKDHKKDRWFGNTVVANKRMYNNQESLLLSGGDKLSKQMMHLYDADCDGWIAMVQRISTDIAADMSVKHLKNTLVSEGWMRNAELTIQATKYFEDNLDDFIKTLSSKGKQLKDLDKETYNILRQVFNEAGLAMPRAVNAESFLTMYSISKEATSKMFSTLKQKYNVDTLQGLYELQDSHRDDVNFQDIKANIKLANAHQQLIATICSMFSENPDTKNFLTELYNHCRPSDGYVLVDDRGSKLGNNFAVYKDVDLEGYARSLKYGDNMSEEERKVAIAKMMLTGEVYQMKSSVADQLESKVFTKKIPNKIQKALRKASQLATSFVMSTPLQLIDRILNYTIYDVGVLGSTNASTLQYLPSSIATIRKYMSSIDSIDEYSLSKDKNLQYLIRYIAASGQSPVDANVFRGERIEPSTIPIIKSYLKKVNSAFNQQNLVARFAYFLDLVHSAESNGEILSTKAGVAYHMMDEIKNIKADFKASDAYDENTQRLANIDAQAAQIIAENLGAVGNNPYGATTLGRMGFMFTTFPLIGARWASNRLQSLAYAFTHLDDGSSVRYLGRNLGSMLLTTTLLLALEIALSEDSQEYLFGEKEEMSEEEIKNAENIIFRGGCVKLFDSMLKGEEVTTSAHNRGTEYALYDSFLKELIELEEDETILDGLGDTFKTQVWSHMPTLIKDPIESIPGNTYLQSTTWATPSDNFFDNYVRKVSGYLMGSAQANAFINSMEATEYEEDKSTWDRISLGLQKAYIEEGSNIKEYKSEYKNYKKAFSIIYEYNSITKENDWTSYDTYPKDEFFTDFKSELNNALKNKTSSSAIYKLIAKYKTKGMSLSAMLSALKSASLKTKLSNMEDLDAFMSSLSDSEKATIKSALAYEDYNYPYIEDIIEELSTQYNDYKKANQKQYSYTPSVSQLLYYWNQNKAKPYSSGNTNYKRYNNTSNYLKHLNTYNNNQNYSPTNTYDYLMNAWKYGQSTDLYGNKYTGYTNIKGDTWTWDGGK